jgi:hypothetical protein
MAWETRNGRGRYLTRSYRENGVVRREYYGCGPAAELVALDHARFRLEHQLSQRQWEEQLTELRAAALPLRQLCLQSDLLMRATLLHAGYHRHKRGRWKRWRGSPPARPGRLVGVALSDLVAAVERGSREAVPALREPLRRGNGTLRQCHRLADQAEAAWLVLAGQSCLLMKESLYRRLAEMQTVLATANSALEAVLARRIALGWLQITYLDTIIDRTASSAWLSSRLRVMDRIRQQAHRDLLGSIKALVTTRPLIPVMRQSSPRDQRKVARRERELALAMNVK